jgi:protein-S-isoprenylcysteine O-methyltransferase Ste14
VTAGPGPAASENSAAPPPHDPRRSPTWPDWIGFAGFVAFAAWLLSGPRSVGIFFVIPVLYELGTAATFLVRGRAIDSITGWGPRVVAYGATFMIPVFVRLATRWHPSWIANSSSVGLRMAGASLWLFGLVLAFWPLWHLRGSFSVEPAARRLVTSGPYQIARHPIYASYGLNFAGFLAAHLTPVMAAVTALWCVLMIVRSRYEERVLARTFPEYAAYRREVGAFGPLPWRRAARVRPPSPGDPPPRAMGSAAP